MAAFPESRWGLLTVAPAGQGRMAASVDFDCVVEEKEVQFNGLTAMPMRAMALMGEKKNRVRVELGLQSRLPKATVPNALLLIKGRSSNYIYICSLNFVEAKCSISSAFQNCRFCVENRSRNRGYST